MASWQKDQIFEKSLAKKSPKGEFVFFEGPPTANGRPGIHHLEARAFKDAIPRYKTMRGYHVRRKGGWDTHGLPVELQVEKELGLKSKKEIESYGIAAFNEKCKESVWTYVHEWEDFTHRMGYWVDLKNPYITYKPYYIESVWNIIKEVDAQKLLYKDYKVVPWCPRCGTALSSHELAQGYEDVKDLSVYVKFKVRGQENTFLLAWTTTPWTLPGNAALAVGGKVAYVKAATADGTFILAKERFEALKALFKEARILEEVSGNGLLGLAYEPLYPFIADGVSGSEKDKLVNAFKVYAADFVTTADGTGIVHIAPMYGQDDFELGTRAGLPKHHVVNDDGTFKKDVGFLAGAFVKDEKAAVDVIKDLAHRGLLFHKEKYEHSYPFCWRCHTPLIYFARDSWYIRMSALRDKLVHENKDIHWEPAHIKDGRFGEWLREVKDWAISRERYWGTPLPIWSCASCQARKVIGSAADVSRPARNTYYVMRHGEAENNVLGVLSGVADAPHHLTEKGRAQVAAAAEELKKIPFDFVYASPFVRTQETLKILKDAIGWKDGQIAADERIREIGSGSWNGRSVADYVTHFSVADRFASHPDGVENFADMKKRMGDFLYDLEKKHEGKTILVITHESPAHMLVAAAAGLDRQATVALRAHEKTEFLSNAAWRKLDFSVVPHNPEYELDLHRPYIDEVTFPCACGGVMARAKEVLDVWFDSGGMPFAQDHYPFEAEKKSGLRALFGGSQKIEYPADFISEAIDQTRGWFYTLHAIGTLMGKGKAYKNVICLGHILDAEGKKMSKSVGNVVSPWDMMNAYGADALRFWMYSVNQPGDSKNFEEKTVDEIVKKVFNLAANVATFYTTYADKNLSAASASPVSSGDSKNVLDRWIIARLDQLIETVTRGMDAYVFLEPTRAIRDFVADLSQWYLRRSRDRFKGEGDDQRSAVMTTRSVLLNLAKVMAPFTPFFAEHLYKEAGGNLESVHLEEWPEAGKVDHSLLEAMKTVRELASRGLEARMAAKINVRQPLARLSAASARLAGLAPELIALVKEEVNVKEVAGGAEGEGVVLDTNITPELKEEGDLRELIRAVQDLRKEKGLSVGDLAALRVPADKLKLAEKYADTLKKSANLSAIDAGEALEITV